jgi:hypothetical protein
MDFMRMNSHLLRIDQFPYNKDSSLQQEHRDLPMTISKKRYNLILLAGLAGGLSEILWIGIYSAVTHVDGLEIARQITAALYPAWVDLAVAPILGMVIHLVLSVVIALLCCKIFIEPLVRRLGQAVILPVCMAVLAGVWVISFLVILPVIDPAFVTLLPFLVTLASKMLFGWAMGIVLINGFVNVAKQTVI